MRVVKLARRVSDRSTWRGVTLLEFIVAVGILGMVVGLMVDLIPLSHIMNRRAWDNNQAEDLATSQMAAARSVGYDNLQSVPVATATARGTVFTYQTTVGPYESFAHLKVVTVEVDWRQNGGARSIVLNGLVTGLDSNP